MTITLQLFGAFREHVANGVLLLPLAADSRVADLRQALDQHARSHWPGYRPGLLASSAFATASRLLREQDPLPTDTEIAVLPPVSGG